MALKPCKECKNQVSVKAKTCPHCGVKNPAISAKEHAVGCLFIVILIAVGVAYCSSPSEPKTPDEQAQDIKARCENQVMAYSMSQRFVEKQLKSPSTADFPPMNTSDVTVNYQGDCRHKVWAYVDSQNSFGATIRTKYYMELQNDPVSDAWSVLDSEM